MLRDDLDGGMGEKLGRRFRREVRYVYIELIHFIAQHKLTQHCKAIILQIKGTQSILDVL